MESKTRIKQIDELGRIVIPKDIRKNLGILSGDELEISLSGEDILIKKTLNRCAFCNSTSQLVLFKNAYICKNCLEEISKWSIFKPSVFAEGFFDKKIIPAV